MMDDVHKLLEEYFPEGVPPSKTIEERLAVAASLESELAAERPTDEPE